jgi:hypothetical protein
MKITTLSELLHVLATLDRLEGPKLDNREQLQAAIRFVQALRPQIDTIDLDKPREESPLDAAARLGIAHVQTKF